MNYPLKIGQPRFLTLDEVLTLHRASIDAYGGADGVLDQGKLEASLGMPQQGFGAERVHEFPFGMAAAYGYHLAMNHAFRDGNKRTAFAAMVVFLRLNGWNFELPDEEAAGLMLGMIEDRRDKTWLSSRLSEHCRSRPSFELRDFFAAMSNERTGEMYNALRAGSKPELGATAEESKTAMPLIAAFEQFVDDCLARGDREAAMDWAIQARLLMMIYRLAEDMGYEW